MIAENVLNEVMSQPEAWRQALDGVGGWPRIGREVSEVVFTGCGSSYYLSLAAAASFSARTGRKATGLPSSEIALYPRLHFHEGESYQLVSASRSGKTTEVLWATDAFSSLDVGLSTTLVCDRDTPLEARSSNAVHLFGGLEDSVVMTRSFTTLLLATFAMAVASEGEDPRAELRPWVDSAAELDWPTSYDVIRDFLGEAPWDNFFFLGGGPLHGLSLEAALKVKEMAYVWSEGYHPLEFRHGAESAIRGRSLVVAFATDDGWDEERRVLDDARRWGAKVVLIGPRKYEQNANVDLFLGVPPAPDWCRAFLMMPYIHLLGLALCDQLGTDPNAPKHESRVVEIPSRKEG